MQEEKEKRELPGALKTLAGVAIVFLLLAAVYVFYQAMQVLFPPNTYETALLATVEDTVDAEGVLLFNESYVAGDGTLGYLVADGERVSAGTAVAEVYSDASQAGLRQQLTQINDQIDLLQKSQNTTSAQMESLRKDRSAALYDLMDALDASDYEDTDAQTEDYLLAQNKLWIITGEVSTSRTRSPRWCSRRPMYRPSWAVPPRSPPRRRAISSVRPVPGGSMPAWRTSLRWVLRT